MSDLPIPPAPPSEEKVKVDLPHKENANYFLHVIDFYRTVLEEVLGKVPPLEVPFLLAFLQGSIEVQNPLATEAFEECREFFRVLYPPFMQSHIDTHPDEKPGEDELLIIIPKPGASLIALTDDEVPRIVMPGSSGVN